MVLFVVMDETELSWIEK